MVKVKITARLQKETDKSYMFVDSSPRRYKGRFMNNMFLLPKSKINVIEIHINRLKVFQYMIVEVPEWILKNTEMAKDEFKDKIEIL